MMMQVAFNHSIYKMKTNAHIQQQSHRHKCNSTCMIPLFRQMLTSVLIHLCLSYIFDIISSQYANFFFSGVYNPGYSQIHVIHIRI